MKIIMGRIFVIFYLKNHENGNAARRCFFIKMKHFYKKTVLEVIPISL